MDALGLLRSLLEPDRLAVIGMLARGPQDSAGIAGHIDQPVSEVVRTLAPYVQAGLVTRIDDRYHLDVDAWRAVARDLPQATPPSPRVAFGMTADEAFLDRGDGEYWRSGGRVV